MNLEQVNPITPTEFALKEYAKKLEAEAKRLRFEADQRHD